MGVWIETILSYTKTAANGVTPFVGVWIETLLYLITIQRYGMSHPSWVCGLKLWLIRQIRLMRCHTLRGCVDWNWNDGLFLLHVRVTPFVGVWIETNTRKLHIRNICSHTLRGCVDWNSCIYVIVAKELLSHPSWVCGLKPPSPGEGHRRLCHTLRGCVDWNILLAGSLTKSTGHTLRGCVDWNLSLSSE